MKKKCIIMSLAIIAMLSLSACTENQYEKDSRSGFKKFTSGDFDSMTDGEREAVNDFLEWADEN